MEKPNVDGTCSDRICTQVFAKISATISHEIKNTLSIINENAGLLDDFAEMAEHSGGLLPLDRVRAVTDNIVKQVDRSNTIMKNLNRFAHSADTRRAQANLEETLSLIVDLTNRQAAMQNMKTILKCPPDIAISTYLLSFEALIYLTLLTLYHSSAEGSTLCIEVNDEVPKITICFTTKNKDDLDLGTYPDDEQKFLAEQVDVSCLCDKNKLFLTFPAVVN